MIKTLFPSVLENSLAISPIILLLVLLTPVLNKKYAAEWKYWIWMVLAFRLLVPIDRTVEKPPVVIDIPRQMTTELSVITQVKQQHVDITPLDVAAGIWLMGGLVMLLVHGFSYVHFRRQVSQNGVAVDDQSALYGLPQMTEELQIRRKIKFIKYTQVTSPMLVGFIHPILVIPDETYCKEEFHFILKHELLHLKRHDIYFKLLLLVVNAIHWFNPMVWIMRIEAAVDMELSCDESVVQGMNLAARKAYTESLLSALDRQCTRETVLSTQFYGGKQLMKKRFKNILTESRKKNGLSLVVCAVIMTLAMGSLIGCSVQGTGENLIGTVNTDTGALRVRDEPGRDAAVITLLPDLAEVTILGEEGDFYHILMGDEGDATEGYVRKEFIVIEY